MKIMTFVEGDISTNTYVCYNDAGSCFIVDPAVDYRPRNEFLAAQSLVPSHIILTHGHGDHTDGVPALKERFPEIKVVANRLEQNFISNNFRRYGRAAISPDIWVEDGEEMSIGDIKLKFITTPGHTPGGMCIYSGDVLFSGDTLFFCSVGRSDLPGGNSADLFASIRDKLFVLPEDTRVLPGHMDETNIGYEKRHNPFV
ncbi:MAG TPA: MBL fold metallo-hydrolase [Bacillota bacterium]|nr:MBL fold metallo-hydrolase [Bacillota bacterium]